LSRSLGTALFGVIALTRFAHMLPVAAFALGTSGRVVVAADLVSRAARWGAAAPSAFTL
jgi:uncharacterized membrane protein YoaK (UPF0700 family)